MSDKDIFVKYLYKKYKEWVSMHPAPTSEMETTLKLMSYLLTSRFNDSTLITELIYCSSNLLTFFNDGIIYSSLDDHKLPKLYNDKLKKWLTVLEYSEVFIELSAQRLWGKRGKWLIIFVIQTFKCIARLKLLYADKEQVVQIPSITPLERKKLFVQDNGSYERTAFILKSGRVIRNVESTNSTKNRSWIPPLLTEDETQKKDKILNQNEKIGETMYIVKPLLHLASVYCFGENTWKPWLLSLAVDYASIYMMRKGRYNNYSKRQRKELARRRLRLLLYLFRSPLYDRQTKFKIHSILSCLSNKIPFFRLILQPLNEHLSEIQKNYFYVWSS